MVNIKEKVLRDVGYDEKKEIEKEELENLREECIKIEYKKDGGVKNVKVNISMVTDYILHTYIFKTIYETKSEKIFVFSNGIYKLNGREVIETQVEKILGSYCNNYHVKEIREKIKRLTTIQKEDFDNIPEELICLENGVLNIRTLKLEDHNPLYYFKRKIPLQYNPKASCPKILNFFKECLYPADIKPIQEWLGYNLYRRYFLKKAVILYGPTDTGKTVFLNLLSKWIGEKNISGLSLQRISSGDKFGLADLKDKYSNIFDDLTTEDMISGGFKIATGGGYITAEHKFGDPFQFQSYAKLIFAGNKIPSIKDIDSEDSAYYSRWMPFAFDNQVSEVDKDAFLKDKLNTETELSGLLNWSLKGLKRLLGAQIFSYKKDWREVKRMMERNSGNPLVAFCQDVLRENPSSKITKEALYQIYVSYIKGKELPILSRSQIGRSLPKFAKYILPTRNSKRYWKNVEINTSLVNQDTLDTITKILCEEKRREEKRIKREKNDVIDLSNIISGEASKVSKKKSKKEVVNDTLDTLNNKDNEENSEDTLDTIKEKPTDEIKEMYEKEGLLKEAEDILKEEKKDEP